MPCKPMVCPAFGLRENDFIPYIFNIAWSFFKCNQNFLFLETIYNLYNSDICDLCIFLANNFVNGYIYNATIFHTLFRPGIFDTGGSCLWKRNRIYCNYLEKTERIETLKKINDRNKLALQMLVTALNVAGDSVTAMAVAKSEGKLDRDIYNN